MTVQSFDELDDVVTTPVTAAKTTPTVVDDLDEPQDKPVQQVRAAAAPAVADDDLDVGFGEKKLMAKGDGLNRIRADKTHVVRFALLPESIMKPKSAKNHFLELKDKKGTYRCLGKGDEPGFCCQKLTEDGQLHVVVLAVLYLNADSQTGGYEKGAAIEWEVGYVDLSRANYRSVSNLAPEESTVYDIDMVMAKKENGIGYEFTLKSPKARWTVNPALKAEVEQAAQKFVRDGGKKLIGKLGKVATLLEWKALLSGIPTNAAEASLNDVEDL